MVAKSHSGLPRPSLLATSNNDSQGENEMTRDAQANFFRNTRINRGFLKSDMWEEWRGAETDQKKQVLPPPLQKPYPEDAKLVDLVPTTELTLGRMPLIEAIEKRRSRRKFTSEALTLEELSFLLWTTQGVSKIFREGAATLRTVPSGGARHPFETYLLVNRVEGLEPGLYRYLPLDHKLCLEKVDADLVEKVHVASYQQYVEDCAVVFIWTVIPYRTEWRYDFISHKIIAMDAGHMCQNLYLASEAVGAGTCAVGAYDQDALDAALGVDGEEEFAIYMAPTGKIG
jgi:SagB-type dehydrogenase family enzyme